jgi:effector-binding domain-containing protein
MEENIQVIENKNQYTLSIRMITKIEEFPNIIGNSYMEIMAYLNELGEKPVDVPFTAYHNLDMQNLDVELGFVVDKKLPDKGAIKSGVLPQGKNVIYMYKGPYSGMQEAYDKIMKWVIDNKYELQGTYYEYYYNSPEEVKESELLTKIVLPVK